MVLTHREPAVVVPDTGSWALWGLDLEARSLTVAASPAQASALALPRVLPAELIEATRAAWSQMPPPRRMVELDGPPLSGIRAAGALAEKPSGSGGAKGGEEDDSGGDMMEITGEPSRDGLVMESIELKHGPLAPGFPGGLVLAVELDGDVVCSCEVRGTLRAGKQGDPLAPAASEATIAHGEEANPVASILAVERERALSHVVWLASFAVVLGWRELQERSWEIVACLVQREDGNSADAQRRAGRLLEWLQGNRRLASRTRGRGTVPAEVADSHGLRGPNARASGLPDDARESSEIYRQLGFSIRVQEAGDAEARVLQRAGEALDSLRLHAAAREQVGRAATAPFPAGVEGPRGPIAGRGNGALVTSGATGARTLAGVLAGGLAWASALAVVASFDLSPWQPGE